MDTQELLRLSLKDYMAQLSQDNWCASWLMGWEYELFDIMRGYKIEKNFCGDLDRLYSLYYHVGGWFVWDDEKKDTVFVDTDTWLEIYGGRNE